MSQREPDRREGRHAAPSSDPIERHRELTEQALEQITEAIIERRQLTNRLLDEIEVEIQAAVRLLDRLGEPWFRGDRTDYEFMRISLDKALTARKKERRDRLVQSWKDLLALQENRRKLERELPSIEE